MNADINLVIQDMQNQVAVLSREKAIFYALATQKEQELQQLQKECDELKKKTEKGEDEE